MKTYTEFLRESTDSDFVQFRDLVKYANPTYTKTSDRYLEELKSLETALRLKQVYNPVFENIKYSI